MLLLGLATSIFGLADLICLVEAVKRIRSIRQKIKHLKYTEYLDVLELIARLKDKPVGHRISVIVKGLVETSDKAKNSNIFSAIVSTPINRTDKLKQYIYDRVPYRNVIKNSFWKRPYSPEDISFSLKDMNEHMKQVYSVSVNSCKGTDLSGMLAEFKTFQTKIESSPNIIVRFFTTLLSIFMPISKVNKIGEKISYYSIMPGSFGYVVGQAKKNATGDIVIENPEIVTKQISFALRKLELQASVGKALLFIFVLINLGLLYALARWVLRKYRKNLVIFDHEDYPVEENGSLNQACIICYSLHRSVIFKPCKHYGVCFSCYNSFKDPVCPICKVGITGIIRIVKK